MKLVLLGPPGAGKGTLATLIKDELGIMHISTGDMLREEMKSGSDLGNEVKQYVESGALVPDEVVIKIIENKLTSDEQVAKGFMLDGFPRTEAQAEELDKILEKIGKSIDYSFYMDASLEVVLQRLTGRRICRDCGAIFHMTNMPPKEAGKCDSCGGEIYQRPDDNEETIKKRMDVYGENTAPVVEYYAGQGKLKKVNADQSTDELFDEMMANVNADKKANQD
ncbi:MAG: adenylate kinase [Candidatus Omnitrophica bacterium]|nr:adenylate kinase [Candidatus Omnitrophota bacterium]